ncbi:MAG: ABC transporter permease [Blautia sp.]|uniref:ABC transporter permease n=1 Tax=Blautia sp. TaxID=1955243 RepID=UPI0025C0D72E|nr:ABC transporter permease [Blautia sp.]MCI7451299.1 ABC transporter permease [Blautia sp.]MDD7359521.1 ABC transporter permease [Mediterraneibacter faecis]
MWKYCIKKTVQVMIVMLLISFLSFAVIYFAPGDISSMYVTADMTEEQKAAILSELGLDKSMMEQYVAWLQKAMHGDMGVSLSNKAAVWPQIKQRLPATMLLMGSSMILSLVLAIPLGLWSGYKKNTWIDNFISSIAYMGMSIPSFWFGMLLIILFSAVLKVLPSSGMHTVGNISAWDTFQHMILPCITLSIGHLAVYIRYIRANTIGQLSEEYVLTAEAKGDSKVKILSKHVLKNTLLPIITLMGMNLASLVCGSFIVESVFGWPGVGTLAMSAIGARDYPIIMAYVMLSGFLLVLGNFLADMLYAFVDPRIKRGGAESGK